MRSSSEEAQRDLGRAIREARRDQGISQEQLALDCGVHRTYLGSVERGERNISLLNITRIAAALGTTASALLGEAGL